MEIQILYVMRKSYITSSLVNTVRRVDLASLLGVSAFSLDRWLEKDPDFLVRTKMMHRCV